MYDDQGAKARKEREEYARGHPIRARILELYEKEPGRSLTAADLQPELEELPGATLAVVAYHVQVLQGAGLLPSDS